MVAGPDGLLLRTPVELHGEDFSTVADFTVAEGDRVPFELIWHPSHLAPPDGGSVDHAIDVTERWWSEWSGRAPRGGPWADAVRDSLVVLKGLTYAPTGGIVAAATTSLPEAIGGVRNWDYRYCWLRDATFTLLALMAGGYTDEAAAWRDWLLRALAGRPDQAQIMYGPRRRAPADRARARLAAGLRGLTPGADRQRRPRAVPARRVRRGARCAAPGPRLGDRRHRRRMGRSRPRWSAAVEERWTEPDDGIWEVRGGPQHFTHSKVMAWVALDRAIRSATRFGLEAPLDRWRARARRHPGRGARAGRRRPRRVRAVLRLEGARRLDA